MRAKEMRERTLEELNKMLVDNKAALFRARLDNATHQLDKTSKIGNTRREIARINTILVEKAQAESATGGEE